MQQHVIQAKVKPNSRVSRLVQCEDGTWLAQIKSLPIDGKANEVLIALIATQFKCRKADVSIKSGASGRVKLVKIEGTQTSAFPMRDSIVFAVDCVCALRSKRS
jgi:uncharacterized protein